MKLARMTRDGDLLTGQRHRPAGALLAANTLAKTKLNEGQQAAADPRGQNLRQLRLQRHADPVMLATQACISLRQLYQLETGEHSLFYCTGLRNQAGRRVATLLGACWDQLDRGALHTAAPNSARPAEASTQGALPIGLGKPASDLLIDPVDSPAQQRADSRTSNTQHSRRPPIWRSASWLLGTRMGAGPGNA